CETFSFSLARVTPPSRTTVQKWSRGWWFYPAHSRRYIEAGLCITPKTRIGSERQDESRLQRESRHHERGPAAQQGLPRKGQAARAAGTEPVRSRGEARGGGPGRVGPPAGRHRLEVGR